MVPGSQEYLVKKKIDYILLRFKVDSKKLNNNLKVELLKRWIQSCVDCEEYEMAMVLKQKRIELIRRIRKLKIGSRTRLRKFKLIAEWYKRKIKRFFSFL